MRWLIIIVLVVIGTASVVILNLVALPMYFEEKAQQSEQTSIPAPVKNEKQSQKTTPQVPVKNTQKTALAVDEIQTAQQEEHHIQPPQTNQKSSSPAIKRNLPTIKGIRFRSGSSFVGQRAQTRLKKVIRIMKLYPDVKVLLRGHSDNRGEKSLNIALSQQRAERSAEFLVNNGISRNRIDIEWAGEKAPSDPRNNERAWDRNRRIEVLWR